MVSEVNRHWSEEFQKTLSFESKKVLEIGCGDGAMLKHIASTFIPERIIGIDNGLESWHGIGESSGGNWEICDGDAENLSFEDKSFDVACSLGTFEHINDVSKALAEIKRVLKPFGKFHTAFSAIWTSVSGHHCSNHEFELCLDEPDVFAAVLPPWSHLYMGKEECEEYLSCQGFSKAVRDYISEKVFNSKCINRLSASTLKQAFFDCGMIIRLYREYISLSRLWPKRGPSELSDEIKERIAGTGYNYSDIGIVSMEVCLEKYAEL